MAREVYVPLDTEAMRARLAERIATIEASTGAKPTGRKLAFEALLATAEHGATTNEVHEVIGGSKSPVRRALERLENEGLIFKVRLTSRDLLYRLTERGRHTGVNYKPPAFSTTPEAVAADPGWGRTGAVRIATLRVLVALAPDDPGLTVRQIIQQAGLNAGTDPAVGRTLKLGVSRGFAEATTPGSAESAGVHRLTDTGRLAAQAYLETNAIPANSFTITFTGDTAGGAYGELLELLAQIAALEEVHVDGLPAPEQDD